MQAQLNKPRQLGLHHDMCGGYVEDNNPQGGNVFDPVYMFSYWSLIEALDKSIFKIEEAILKALEQTPPELAGDIYRRGLYITGGGALLRGLDKRLANKIKLPVHIADDPLKSVVRGTGIALKNYSRFPFVMR